MEYSIYCDESCHLEKDKQSIMLIGAIWCPSEKKDEINLRIKAIKKKYNVATFKELKWSKLSASLYNCYEDLVNYFFDDDDLKFRCLIVKNKNMLDYKQFNHDHDTFYYKMYYYMLDNILHKDEFFNIFLDVKDTRSSDKINKLREVLCNHHQSNKKMIQTMQNIKSHEVQIMQLTDIFLGAFAYKLRNLNKVEAKNNIIKLIEERSGHNWQDNSKAREIQFNIFYLELKERKIYELF